ncbi:MAG: hypothetical protein WAK44_11620, partial [Trebonia sp.]|uniref:hypothetical protein n=1 Tax=Trebonia sp. TaxID=2767075 RepID=UPI003BB13B03
QALSAAAEADPAAWADLNSRFDNRAALAFYRELSELPADFLVNNLPCPLFAFWGEEDEEIARGGGVRAARRRAGPPRAQARVLPRSRPRRHAGPYQ